MKIINVGASCGTCLYKDKSKPGNCHRCMNANGRPGWDPLPGVKLTIGQDWLGRTTRRVVETTDKSGGAA